MEQYVPVWPAEQSTSKQPTHWKQIPFLTPYGDLLQGGPVHDLSTNQGTKIVGAKNEFRRALEEMGHGAIQRYLSALFSADWQN